MPSLNVMVPSENSDTGSLDSKQHVLISDDNLLNELRESNAKLVNRLQELEKIISKMSIIYTLILVTGNINYRFT